MDTNYWRAVAPADRSIVRAYINSENPDDRERAIALCKRYGLDYQEMRQIVLNELIAQSRELGKAWTPAEGSRPLSEEKSDA